MLEDQECQFAVKSGGHGMFTGASNIQQGITIDLLNLNQITVSSDKTQVSVGAGNRWYDVYTKLDPMGISVIGGRVAGIGVGGLTLGGGISFFSGRYGWACDNVNNYEVGNSARSAVVSLIECRLSLPMERYVMSIILHIPTFILP